MDRKPIEKNFPVTEVNRIADKESKAKRYYRPIYTIHKWWARRLGCVFRTILLYALADGKTKYYDELINTWKEMDEGSLQYHDLFNNYYLKDIDFGGKIVLDPFMGGGTTVVEALRMGCKVVGCDLNPVAWFTVKKEIEPVDIDLLKQEFDKLISKVEPVISKYYKTTCKHCGNLADAMYYFWIKELTCLNCHKIVPLSKSYMLANRRGKTKGYWVICPDCGEIFTVDDYKKDMDCPQCKCSFNPSERGNVNGGYYICPHCSQKDKIVDNIDRNGKPSERIYAVEYYCESCDNNEDNISLMTNGKSYKKPDAYDFELYDRAKNKYYEMKDKLVVPDQDIPPGKETNRLPKHGYTRFKDMFNERQLLSLGKVVKEILDIEDQNIREFAVLCFSKTLEFQNMLCEYTRTKNHLYNLFSKHAFQPKLAPLENNFIGSKYGRGIFTGEIEGLINGKKYNLTPFEWGFVSGKKIKKKMKNEIRGSLCDSFNQLGKENCNSLLLQGDSSYLNIPDKSVDAVITDPPYFDNVNYSELSDFYFVWLRELLKDRYEEFDSLLTPKSTEVVKNSVRGKSKEDFVNGLTSVFSESHRKLKDEGIMVFTFHHKDSKAWGSVLKSVLEAGFYVSSVYPVQSEASINIHILNKANVEYDMIIVCRKRLEKSDRKSWQSIENRIYSLAEKEIDKLETSKSDEEKRLSKGDIFIISMGKCLEVYSKHYPNVIENEKMVSVQEAVDRIQDIVDERIMSTRVNELANELDTPTAIYLTFLTKPTSISYQKLNKEFQMRNISMNSFLKEGLVEKEGNKLLIKTAIERKNVIEDKREKTYIDKAHYLYYLYKEGNLPKNFKKWVDKKTIKTLEYLHEFTSNKDYREIAKYIKKNLEQERLKI